MRKNQLLVLIALLFVMIYILFSNTVLGAEEEQNVDVNQETVDDKVEEKQKDEVLQNIQDYISAIREEISNMDKKLNSLKSKKEYTNYPAIRLNIDTPMFGLVSIANQKLKITNEVSAIDIARGYSIRDIIKSNSLKVPSFSVVSIVVITRDIKLNKDISLSDANTAILKLTEYVNQVESVNDFLDTQISKIYGGYIPKDKADTINELKTKLSNFSSKLNKLDENIIYTYVLNSKNETVSSYIDKFLEFSKDIYNANNSLENVLIEDKELDNIKTKVDELEVNIDKFEKEVEEYISNTSKDINIENVLLNYRNYVVSIRDNIKKYIDESTKKDESKNSENSDNKENLETTQTEQDVNNAEIQNSYIQNENVTIFYEVISENILDYMNSTIEYVDSKIKEILGESVLNNIKGIPENTPEEVINKGDVIGMAEKELTQEEKEALIYELAKKYKEIVSKDYSFYIDNMNFLLKDTKEKVSALSKQTEANVLISLKYVYLELPKFLDKNLDLYNEDNVVIETETFASKLKTELNKLCDTAKTVNKIYDEKKKANEIKGS